MTDNTIESNAFYRHVKEHHGDYLSEWCEPSWMVCIPQQSVVEGLSLSLPLIEAHALKHRGSDGRYVSALCGNSIVYELSGEEPRVIISNKEGGVSKTTVLNEYLVTFKDKVIHLLLVDKLLNTAQDQDDQVSDHFLLTAITSFAQAETFLSRFRCHKHDLVEVDELVRKTADHLHPSTDVGQMQNVLQDVLIQCWEKLLKKHSPILQIDTRFQDLLFRALD